LKKREFNYQALIGEDNPLLRFPALKEAAIDEFSEKSFSDASLNEILKKAGMSKGSFYHHFGDKFGLYLAMMDLIVQKKLSFFYPLLQQGIDFSDFFETLKAVMRATLEFMMADERMHHLSIRFMDEEEKFRKRFYGFFVNDYTQNFNEYVYQAVQSGQVDSRYPPAFVANVIEILTANLNKLISSGDPDHLLATAYQVVDVLQRGIAPRPEYGKEKHDGDRFSN